MHCVSAITKALQALEGVAQVNVSLETKSAMVSFNNQLVTLQTLKDTIEDLGYDVE